MRFSMKSNIEQLWGTSKDETFHLLVTKKVADLEIMAFHLRRQHKFVADPDEMSHQGTKQSHPQGHQHLSGLFSLRDPKAAQGTSKTDCRGADGWQPRSLTTASGRGNQPAGVTRSPTGVARPPVTSRKMATIGWELR